MKRVLYTGVLTLIGVVILCSPVRAETYELTQEIYGPHCSHDHIETADQENDADCPVFGPQVVRHQTVDASLRIEGVYDAVHARDLVIWFDDRRYQAGKDSALTTRANRWLLTFEQPPSGSHDIWAVMVDHSNQSYSSSHYSIHLYEPSNNIIAATKIFLASTGWPIIAGVVISFCLIASGIWMRHKASRPKDDSS